MTAPVPSGPGAPAPLAVTKAGEVMGQMRLINGIFAALNSSIEIADLQLILLAVLTSPRGLGFTRAHLFVAGAEGHNFTGRLALGCGSAREVAELEEEIRGEEALLSSMAAQSASRRGASRRDLDDLRSQAWWITAFQRAQADNPLTQAIHDLPLLRARARAPQSLAQRGDIRALHVQGAAAARFLDSGTRALLWDDFLLGPLRTKRGLRAIVAVDKAFRPQGITRGEQANLEWLCNQASLALENAELFDDLRRAYGEIQAVDKMKSSFLSTISHELKTPLTSIFGFVQLILDGRVGEVSPEVQRLLGKVVAKSRDLSSMVNDILEIAEIQAGGLVRLEREPVALEDVIERAIHRVAQRRRPAAVEIEHRRPARALPPVLADEQAVERIAYHVVDNAVKFIPVRGKVTVSYHLASRHVDVSIRDTGIGIPPEHLSRIFDHFYQVEGDLNRNYNGIGLGLAVTKKLITVLDAQVHVRSTVGRGTTFRLSFPRMPEENGNGA